MKQFSFHETSLVNLIEATLLLNETQPYLQPNWQQWALGSKSITCHVCEADCNYYYVCCYK